MKSEYDFSKGKRGKVSRESPVEPGKSRVTIRLDEDIIDYFGAAAGNSGGVIGNRR